MERSTQTPTADARASELSSPAQPATNGVAPAGIEGSIATGTPVATSDLPDPSPERLRAMWELMLLARSLDERMWLLNRAGQAPFAVSCQGHEAAQAGMAMALDDTQDWLVPYYRDLALVLGMGMTPEDVMLQFLSRATDPSSGGRQMPAHYSSREKRILSVSSPVGTQLVQAPGIALAAKMRGEDSVTVTCIGEGGTATGEFHEALNLAAIHKLAVIFFVQNNNYAISVPMDREVSVPHVADRASAYGIPGFRVDGNDGVAMYTVAQAAVAHARGGHGPVLIEAVVNRFTPHSSDDDDRFYRTREEVEGYRDADPIDVTLRRLREMQVLDDAAEEAIRARVKQQVNAATDAAESAPVPDPETAHLHVYYTPEPTAQ